MYQKIFCALTAMTLYSVQSHAQLLRTVSIHPEGTQLAFSYQGDIWTSNVDGTNPQRLTIHAAYEDMPIWSKDGRSLAFTANRKGNKDIYTFDLKAGKSKRITHYSGSDNLSDWTKENQLIFGSKRAFQEIEREDEILSVDANGGNALRIADALGFGAKQSPNAQFIAFERGSCRRSREAYQGSASSDIWILNQKTGKYSKLTDNNYNDYNVRWKSDSELLYLSAKTGVYNIYAQKIKEDATLDGKATAVTTFKKDGIRSFNISKDGIIVFEREDKVYLLKGKGKATSIRFALPEENRFDEERNVNVSSRLSDYVLSPSEKQVALELRGEIFLKENDKKQKLTVNASKHAFRDRYPTWLNDSTLLYCSDRNGQYDIYCTISTDTSEQNLMRSLKHETRRLTTSKENEHSLLVAPNGQKIVFKRGRGELVVADIDSVGNMTNEYLLQDGWAEASGVAWSPDSRYIAYAISDLNFNSDIFIQGVEKGDKPVNVSMHPRGDYSPSWSADGSKLAFSSNRIDDYDIWYVYLREADWEQSKAEKSYQDFYTKKEDKQSADLVIDFDNIHDRLVRLTSLDGNESQPILSKDGEVVYFSAKATTAKGTDIFSVKWDRTDLKQMTRSGQGAYGFTLDKAGKYLYYVSKGQLKRIDVGSSKVDALSFKANMNVNRKEEQKQKFEEAWRILEQGFYDPQFHGQDWKALKKKYKPWIMQASTEQDFQYMVNIMLGQLNASHMGFYGVSPERNLLEYERSSFLGVEFSEITEKGAKIAMVIPRTPAAKKESLLKTGEYIKAIDGQAFTSSRNYYELLLNKADQRVLLLVEGVDGKDREVVIRPTRSLRNALYEKWIDGRKALVDKYSGGKLGYIHIKGMNMQSFERFERELMASGYGKEGIVIDVRFNGGGWTTDYLMAVLNVKQHAYTVPRGAVANLNKEHKKYENYYPYSERLPLSSWTKPSVALCNQNSYSNAEIFSHAYKNLGIGTLVGVPSFGAVISTSGRSLIDGSFVRLPFRAWYAKATGENMELIPAIPDIILENSPNARAKQEDEQLKKAVETLLEDLKK